MKSEELLSLERAGWQALATDAHTARRFYDDHLATDVVMVFPGDVMVVGREDVLASIDDDAWERFDLADERVVALGEGAALVTYRATAVRAGQQYRALCTSAYRNEGGDWRLVLHQQTPT